jgi:hypothetical protein
MMMPKLQARLMSQANPSNRRGSGFAGPLAVPYGGRRRSRFGGFHFQRFISSRPMMIC